jgi:hemerythrin
MASECWADEVSGTLADLERQHEELAGRAERLFDAPHAGEGGAARQVLIYFDTYVRFHFAQEEACMEELAFPGATAHRSEHRACLSRLKAIQELSAQGRDDTQVSTKLANLLRGWLLDHVGKVDRTFEEYARAFATASAPRDRA